MKFRRIYSNKVDKSTGLRCDQQIRFTGFYPKKDYPETIRRVKYYDCEHKKMYVYLTNNFEVSAITIALLYKNRWKVELFFKWIKQHLKIKSFYGTSFNAVRTQIWISVSIYVIIAIIKKSLKLEKSLYNILQILSVSVFEKVPMYQLLTNSYYRKEQVPDTKQLTLFDL